MRRRIDAHCEKYGMSETSYPTALDYAVLEGDLSLVAGFLGISTKGGSDIDIDPDALRTYMTGSDRDLIKECPAARYIKGSRTTRGYRVFELFGPGGLSNADQNTSFYKYRIGLPETATCLENIVATEPSTRVGNTVSALEFAIARGKVEMVRLLVAMLGGPNVLVLRYGIGCVRPAIRDDNGILRRDRLAERSDTIDYCRSPLNIALRYGRTDIVGMLLLEFQADYDYHCADCVQRLHGHQPEDQTEATDLEDTVKIYCQYAYDQAPAQLGLQDGSDRDGTEFEVNIRLESCRQQAISSRDRTELRPTTMEDVEKIVKANREFALKYNITADGTVRDDDSLYEFYVRNPDHFSRSILEDPELYELLSSRSDTQKVEFDNRASSPAPETKASDAGRSASASGTATVPDLDLGSKKVDVVEAEDVSAVVEGLVAPFIALRGAK
ncbi:hypothetical protein BJ508DRAFT_335585 [Ascobolus immersus RN42]|uniref:Ankyrin n=1 Tax=Ascobolus immersus RN42 TaxID=1160509 RepID=A0A3N4HBZ3_ASCIM|nr:hypothetical protein BJ508DRAFT_335585 [Ascobolus immersus RN42]